MERRCWVNFQCRGFLLVWMRVGQGPIALAVGAGGGLFGHFLYARLKNGRIMLYPSASFRPSVNFFVSV